MISVLGFYHKCTSRNKTIQICISKLINFKITVVRKIKIESYRVYVVEDFHILKYL